MTELKTEEDYEGAIRVFEENVRKASRLGFLLGFILGGLFTLVVMV